jgi:tetratricopeptide (TPR) repeat protein
MARPQDARREAEALALAGQRLFETGAIEGARAKFIEATRIDSTYSQGYVGIGVTYYMRDRYDEALDFYKKGLEADPGNRDAYYNMACVYALASSRSDDKGSEYAERAMALLSSAVEADGPRLGPWWPATPALDALRQRPDFQQLISRTTNFILAGQE